MAIDDLFKLHDASLASTFSQKPYDPTKDRAALVKALDAAIEQFNNGRTKVPNRMWSVSNGVVEFKPKFKGKPIALSGTDTFYVPQERFEEAVGVVRKAVEFGELDEVFQSGGDKTAPATAQSGVPKAARAYDNVTKASFKINGMSRGANPKSEKEIRAELLKEGFTKEDIDAAYKRRADKKKS